MLPVSSQNPYPGLRPYSYEQADRFYGRSATIEKILYALQTNGTVHLVGPSGCGKSSLLFAGLIPAIQGGGLQGDGHGWRFVVFAPGTDPIGNLAKSLYRSLVHRGGLNAFAKPLKEDEIEQLGSETDFETLAKTEPARFARVLTEVFKSARLGNVVIVVDQLEELFRLGARYVGTDLNARSQYFEQKRDIIRRFYDLLVALRSPLGPQAFLVTTLRIDYLADCNVCKELLSDMTERLFLVGELTEADVRDAIRLPAATVKVQLAPDLENELISDMRREASGYDETIDPGADPFRSPDPLPLLQHALQQLFYYRGLDQNDRDISIEDYGLLEPHLLKNAPAAPELEKAPLQTTRLSRILAAHAEGLFAQLSSKLERMAARRLFLSLTELESSGRSDIRRFLVSEDIFREAGSDLKDGVAKALKIFSESNDGFLISRPQTFDGAASDDLEGHLIQVSHESLFRHWPRLGDWIAKDRQTKERFGQLVAVLADAHRLGEFEVTSELWEIFGQWWIDARNDGIIWPEWVARHFHPNQPILKIVSSTSNDPEKEIVELLDRAFAKFSQQQQELARLREIRNRKRVWQLSLAMAGLIVCLISGGVFFSLRANDNEAISLSRRNLFQEGPGPAATALLNIPEFRARPEFDWLLVRNGSVWQEVVRIIAAVHARSDPKQSRSEEYGSIMAIKDSGWGAWSIDDKSSNSPVVVARDQQGRIKFFSLETGDEIPSITPKTGGAIQSADGSLVLEYRVGGPDRRASFALYDRQGGDEKSQEFPAPEGQVIDIAINSKIPTTPVALVLMRHLNTCSLYTLRIGSSVNQMSGYGEPWRCDEVQSAAEGIFSLGNQDVILVVTKSLDGIKEVREVDGPSGQRVSRLNLPPLWPGQKGRSRPDHLQREGLSAAIVQRFGDDDRSVAVSFIGSRQSDSEYRFGTFGNIDLKGAALAAGPRSEMSSHSFLAAAHDISTVYLIGGNLEFGPYLYSGGEEINDIEFSASRNDPPDEQGTPRLLYVATNKGIDRFEILSADGSQLRQCSIGDSGDSTRSDRNVIGTGSDLFQQRLELDACSDRSVLTWSVIRRYLQGSGETLDLPQYAEPIGITSSSTGFRLATIWRFPDQDATPDTIVQALFRERRGIRRDVFKRFQSGQCKRYAFIQYDRSQPKDYTRTGDDRTLAAFCEETLEGGGPQIEYFNTLLDTSHEDYLRILPWDLPSPPEWLFTQDGGYLAVTSNGLTKFGEERELPNGKWVDNRPLPPVDGRYGNVEGVDVNGSLAMMRTSVGSQYRVNVWDFNFASPFQAYPIMSGAIDWSGFSGDGDVSLVMLKRVPRPGEADDQTDANSTENQSRQLQDLQIEIGKYELGSNWAPQVVNIESESELAKNLDQETKLIATRVDEAWLFVAGERTGLVIPLQFEGGIPKSVVATSLSDCELTTPLGQSSVVHVGGGRFACRSERASNEPSFGIAIISIKNNQEVRTRIDTCRDEASNQTIALRDAQQLRVANDSQRMLVLDGYSNVIEIDVSEIDEASNSQSPPCSRLFSSSGGDFGIVLALDYTSNGDRAVVLEPGYVAHLFVGPSEGGSRGSRLTPILSRKISGRNAAGQRFSPAIEGLKFVEQTDANGRLVVNFLFRDGLARWETGLAIDPILQLYRARYGAEFCRIANATLQSGTASTIDQNVCQLLNWYGCADFVCPTSAASISDVSNSNHSDLNVPARPTDAHP